jgi:hypothetical protein
LTTKIKTAAAKVVTPATYISKGSIQEHLFIQKRERETNKD